MITLRDIFGVEVTAPRDIIGGITTLKFYHTHGYFSISMSHDRMNALRSLLMYATDYPDCILSPSNNTYGLSTVGNIVYTDWGDMNYDGKNMIIKTSALFKSNQMNIDISPFGFNIHQYIEMTDGGKVYIEPYYSYYKSQSIVRLSLDKFVIDGTCNSLNREFPYERFSSLNEKIYTIIREV